MNTLDANKQVGQNIRRQRLLKNLSQGDLARALGVDRSYVSSLESGTRNPSVSTLEKVAHSLGIGSASLLATSKYKNSIDATKHALAYLPGHLRSKEADWQGKKWYHQRFDASPYLVHMIAEAEILARREEKYGLFFDRHFCFFEDGKGDWYIDNEEIERVTSTILKLAQKFPTLGKKLRKDYQPLEAAFDRECAKLGQTDLGRLSNQQLIALHDEFLEIILNRNSSSSIIDGFALGSDRLLEEKIKKAYEANKRLVKAQRFSEVFTTLTAPTHSSFVREAEVELFRLVLKLRAYPAAKRKLIQEYRNQFFWIKNNYIDANVLGLAYFEEEVARIDSTDLDVAAEIKSLEDLPRKNRVKKAALLEKLPLDDQTRFLLTLTDEFTQWQDERKKATMLTAHHATRLLDEISRRVGTPTELLKYMSPREVSRIFLDSPSVDLLQARQAGSVAYWDKDGHEILSGPQVSALRKELLGEKAADSVQDFRGMTASLGKAQGRVKILRSVKEIGRMEKGDILVAVMTRPDYVPAMRMAAAIVTDEGGITSHAAIVSRELKIPCVIGTKIATQVLSDGDLVRVNADHGVIQILEKAPVRVP
jgi:phosphohistidine swiveling domain-containing protein/transcriptional regulator with XRE-family HTH domain